MKSLNRLLLYIFGIIGWEIGVLFLAKYLESDVTNQFLLAARYSARTSFVLLSLLLLWMGTKGLYQIFGNEKSRGNYKILLLLFSVNHLIHFIYLVTYHYFKEASLISPYNAIGALAYIAVLSAPFYLWNKDRLSKGLYRQIYIFFFAIVGVFAFTYFGRFLGPSDLPVSMLFIKIALSILAGLVILNGYRMSLDN